MKNKKIFALLGVLALSSILSTVALASGPSGSPPTGTVDAQFNSVATATLKDSTGGTTLFSMLVGGVVSFVKMTFPSIIVTGSADVGSLVNTTAGAQPVTVTDADGFDIGNAAHTTGLIFTAIGNISNAVAALPVTFNDPDGISSTAPAVTGVAVHGDSTLGVGVSGTSSGSGIGVAGGSSTGTGVSGISTSSYGVVGNSNTSASGHFLNLNSAFSADLATTAAAINAVGIIKNEFLTIDKLGNISAPAVNAPVNFNDADGILSTAAAKPAITGTSTSSSGVVGNSTTGAGGHFVNTGGNSVDLGTATAAVDATGIIKNAGLIIAANGDISDVSGPVTTNDAQGIQIDNGAGVMSAYIDGAGQIFTNNNLFAVGGVASGAGLNTSGDIVDGGNLNVTGHIKSTGGIGTITERSAGSTATVVANGYNFGTVACATGERVLSCSFTTGSSNSLVQADMVVGSNSCNVYVKNLTAAPASLTFTPTAVCYNPGA